MSRPSYNPRDNYLGDGVTDTYSFDFKITDESQLLIKVYDADYEVVFSVDGNDTTYLSSIEFDPIRGGGQIVLADPLTSGYHLALILEPAFTQPDRYRNAGDFSLDQLEQSLDVQNGQTQKLKYLIDRALKLADGVFTDFDTDITPIANAVPIVNATNNAVEFLLTSEFVPTILFGSGVPSGALGINGSVYIDTTTGNLYKKIADAWVLQGNITGPQGPSGEIVGLNVTGELEYTDPTPLSVTNSGTAEAAILNFVLRKGPAGISTVIFTVDGIVPNNLIGGNGDVWLVLNDALPEHGNFYQKVTGTYTLRGNMIGPPGPSIVPRPIGAVPNANGMTEAAGDVTLQPADDTFGGVVSTTTQFFAGLKKFVAGLSIKDSVTAFYSRIIFNSGITADRSLTINTGDSDRTLTLTGNASIEGTNTGDENVTADRAVVSDGLGNMAASATTATQIGYLSTVTSNVQGQIDSKADGAATTAALGLKANDADVVKLTGAQSIAGVKTFSDYLKRSSADGITAFATGGQASATALTKDINRIATCATAGDSVKLPAATPGMMVVVLNDGAAIAAIFPSSGETIDAGAANASVLVNPTSGAIYFCTTAGAWQSISLGGSGAGETIQSTPSSPDLIVAASGVTSSQISTTLEGRQIVYCEGSVAATLCDISANPQIVAHTVVGAYTEFIGTSNTAPVQFDNGNGLALKATSRILNADSVLGLRWSGSEWREVSWSE